MEKDEVAILRLSTDIFLYGQTTDAISASAMEYLYAGTVLIKPKWLDYSELSEAVYYEYGRFEDIPSTLETVLEDRERVFSRPAQNRKQFRAARTWEVLASKWEKLYKEKANGKQREKVSMAKWKYRQGKRRPN